MKRKLALMLTMTLLAGSLDSGMLVSAADFSAEESVEQAVEEELFPAVHPFLPSFKQCTSLTRIHIPASMVTHGYVGESPAYPGIFAADDGHLCERDRKDRQVQNSPSAQKAGPAAITPSPAAQVVITPPPQQPGSAYHHKYRRIQGADRHSVPL